MNETLIPALGGYLRSDEKVQLVARTVSELESSKVRITDDDVKRLLTRLKGKVTAYQALQEPVRWSEHTDKLKEADRVRDADVTALFASIRAYRQSHRPAEQTAYKTLTALVKQYKDVTGRNYEEETAAIARLLTQLKSDDYRDDITALNLTHHVTHLTESQTAFETLFTARMKTVIAKPDVDHKQLRDELFEEYQRFCHFIDALAWGKDTDVYVKLLAIINKVRKHYADVVHKRTGRTKKRDAKTEQATSPEVVTEPTTSVTDTPEGIGEDTQASSDTPQGDTDEGQEG